MDNLTELYCLMDDFCKVFEPQQRARLLAVDGKRWRARQGGLSLAEWMTLVVLFHKRQKGARHEINRNALVCFLP